MLRLEPHKDFRLDTHVHNHDGLATLIIDSTWVCANHPDPHRMLTLTLPPAQLRQLAYCILSEL